MKLFFKNIEPVLQAYNPSYSGGRDQRSVGNQPQAYIIL
jgi:hypothetical protein